MSDEEEDAPGDLVARTDGTRVTGRRLEDGRIRIHVVGDRRYSMAVIDSKWNDDEAFRASLVRAVPAEILDEVLAWIARQVKEDGATST